MANFLNRPIERTINLHEKKDPIRLLWRNVLILGIEDLLRKTVNKHFKLGSE